MQSQTNRFTQFPTSLAKQCRAARFGDAGVAIVGLAGVVLVSHDRWRAFTLVQQSDRAGLSAVVPVGEDELAAVGEDGAKVIVLKDAPADAGAAR